VSNANLNAQIERMHSELTRLLEEALYGNSPLPETERVRLLVTLLRAVAGGGDAR
jgi:hypothetical protein